MAVDAELLRDPELLLLLSRVSALAEAKIIKTILNAILISFCTVCSFHVKLISGIDSFHTSRGEFKQGNTMIFHW